MTNLIINQSYRQSHFCQQGPNSGAQSSQLVLSVTALCQPI